MALYQARQPAKKRPTKKFTRVKNTEFNKEGSVQERLSKQFTVNYDDGSFGFLFYEDEGVTWVGLREWDGIIEAKPDNFRAGKSFSTFITKNQYDFAALSAKIEAAVVAAEFDTMIMDELAEFDQ